MFFCWLWLCTELKMFHYTAFVSLSRIKCPPPKKPDTQKLQNWSRTAAARSPGTSQSCCNILKIQTLCCQSIVFRSLKPWSMFKVSSVGCVEHKALTETVCTPSLYFMLSVLAIWLTVRQSGLYKQGSSNHAFIYSAYKPDVYLCVWMLVFCSCHSLSRPLW